MKTLSEFELQVLENNRMIALSLIRMIWEICRASALITGDDSVVDYIWGNVEKVGELPSEVK